MKLLVAISLLVSGTSFCQVSLDSLFEVWNDESEADTNRINALSTIVWEGYMFRQPDSALYFAKLQYQFAKKKKLRFHEAGAMHILGTAFYVLSESDSALTYYFRSLEIRLAIGDQQGIARSYNNIGLIYQDRGDFAKSIEYYTNSLKIKERMGDEKGVANSQLNIARIYESMNDYEKAMDYLEKSLPTFKKLGDKQQVAGALNNMAIIGLEVWPYNKSIRKFQESLELFEGIDDRRGVTRPMTGLGTAYRKMADSLRDAGDEANAVKTYGISMGYFEKSYDLKEELGDLEGMANSLHNMGMNYFQLGQYKTGVVYNKRSLELSVQIDALEDQRAAYQGLIQGYRALKNHKDALWAYEMYVELDDSLKRTENQKEVIRQEYKYSYEKQAAADSIQAAEAAKVKDAELAAEHAENVRREQQSYYLYGGLFLALIFGGFIFNRFKVTSKQKGIIEEQKHQVDEAFEQLEEKNQEIVDSINYAKRIQNAILPPRKLVKEHLPDSFILYKPKDIVAGDFYWLEPFAKAADSKGVLFAAADCTGHGVPGAMVSVVCNNGLNRTVREYGLTDPAKILDKTREIVIQEFEKSEEEVKDGMDIALCSLELPSMGFDPLAGSGTVQLKYAGAHNPLWIIRNGAAEIEEIKANKQPIGKFAYQEPYVTHTIELQKGDSIYIFSDGFPDQFGGEKGKKFKAANFKKLLLSIQEKSMEEQNQLLDEAFETWRGSLEQLDDVCVIGVRV